MKTKDKIIQLLRSTGREGVDKLIQWLEHRDFFTAPCSIKHHNNFEGGLAEHSWNVYILLKEKNERYKLCIPWESVILVGLLHDVCKVDFYEKALDKETGKVIYVYNDKYPLGHGEKSIIMVQKYIYLTKDEQLMIRWHMSCFDISSYSKQTYYNAVEMCPGVVALFAADYEATTFLERIEK